MAVTMLAASCVATADPTFDMGAARLRVLGPLDAAAVVATIQGASDGEFEPITIPLGLQGTSWGASTTGVPAGPGRRFEVAAYDGTGAVRYAGSATTDVAPGMVLDLSILLQEWPPPPSPPPSTIPVIQVVSASPGVVAPGASSLLSVTALDEGPLQYEWSADCGTFSTPAAPIAVWTAPGVEGSCTLSIKVGGPSGGTTTVFLPLDVLAPVP